MAGNHSKKYSNIQEKRIAKKLKGEKQLASGALPIASKKGDVRTINSSNWKLLIDGKTTMAKTNQKGVRSKVVHKDELLKVEQQCREGGYDISALAISFDNKTDYYILKDIDFRNLYDAVRDYEKIVEEQSQRISELENLTNNKSVIKYAEIELED